ncbi:substrate-binding domain-containing protein [Streptococcus pneumoniae]|uniref:substrate-binding domain-containing protein n=1 Tax=Streptococcus pneumoniae TaxID=1313 RepID=UPI000B5935A4|nr:substrate-binding domain-containing protein [Streptococcus pneumoniae]SNG29131.1 catabolite control protein A [Streptococcus pneumoniae]
MKRFEVSTEIGSLSVTYQKQKKVLVCLNGAGLLPSYENFSLILEKPPPTIGYLTIDFPNTGRSPIHDQAGKNLDNLAYAVFESKYSYDDGYALAERLISSNATAAVVTGDELAAGVLNGLADKGVSVPEDFEIITSDDSQISRFTRPNLTTIAQPLYDLGAISMRMLTKIMHKEELEEREVLLPHGLTERSSTRKRK